MIMKRIILLTVVSFAAIIARAQSFHYYPLKRALKNYRYFHFIGVVRRHYRAFTRRSGYDVW